jgi:hypothetical protein
MNVEIGAEAALLPEKEYIRGIFVAVRPRPALSNFHHYAGQDGSEDCLKSKS